MKAAVFAVLFAVGCSRTEATPGPKESSGATKSGVKSSKASGDERDLSNDGLPLAIEVPPCVKVARPMVKVEDNKSDLILACEPKGMEQGFAIQLGPAAGKIWKKEMQADLNFKRWIKTDADFIHAEMTQFSSTVQSFIYKTKIGGKEYACFNQFPAADEKLVASMIAACRSLRAP